MPITMLQLAGAILKNVVGPALGVAIGLFGSLLSIVNNVITAVGNLLGALGHIKDAVSGALGGLKNAPLLGGILQHIPGFAEGTTSAPGGLATLAENGPEVVIGPSLGNLAQGSKVIPMSQLAGANMAGLPTGLSGGLSGQIVIQLTNVTKLDGRTIAQNTAKHLPAIVQNSTGVRLTT